MKTPTLPFIATVPIATACLVLSAGQAHAREQNLADLDLRTLMDMKIEVTSVAKKATRISDSPAAVTVITQDDMRRLGITQVPEALRLVPGLDVARINATQWAISSRGFNQQYANKLLVLIDGRSVYTPTFGGVLWGVQDLLIDDIDRIEVIRGPGAALWGANAVNGVINITTRSAADTQGGLLESVAGSVDRPGLNVRYGSQLGDALSYRVYAKYAEGEGFETADGTRTPDDSDSLRGGFRTDWDIDARNRLTLQTEAFSARDGEHVELPSFEPPFVVRDVIRNEQHGTHLLGRWTRRYSDASEMSLQGYVEHSHLEGIFTVEERETFDLQWEHRMPLGARHDVIWGAGYRLTSIEVNETGRLVLTPGHRDLELYTMFVQDEIALLPERLSLTLGAKLEHNDYTAFEFQPNARLRWAVSERHTLWGSLAHAVSTPSRLSREGRFDLDVLQTSPSDPLVRVALLANPDVESERLNAFELGYRFSAAANFSLDVAGFYNRYCDLSIVVPEGTTSFEHDPVPHVLVKQEFANALDGHSYGAEVSVQWQPVDAWRATATYSLLEMRFDDARTRDASPRQQASVRSYLNLPRSFELNVAAYYVDRTRMLVRAIDSVAIDDYLRLDAGLTWRGKDSFEVGLWGRNLLDRRHREAASFNTTLLTEVPRSVLARVTYRF